VWQHRRPPNRCTGMARNAIDCARPAQPTARSARPGWAVARPLLAFVTPIKIQRIQRGGAVTVSFVALGRDDFRRLSCSGAGGSVAALGRALCHSATRLRPPPEHSLTQPRSRAAFDHFGCAPHFGHPSRPPSPARGRDQIRQPLGHPPRNATITSLQSE
jgi:hypothetical protein